MTAPSPAREERDLEMVRACLSAVSAAETALLRTAISQADVVLIQEEAMAASRLVYRNFLMDASWKAGGDFAPASS